MLCPIRADPKPGGRRPPGGGHLCRSSGPKESLSRLTFEPTTFSFPSRLMVDPLFTFFAIFTVVCAVGVVVNKNTVNAAMCLMLTLVGVAGLFVLLNAYLLAALLILVYAGAVVALFLFIVMLLDMQGGVKIPFTAATMAAGGLAAGLLMILVLSLHH